MELYITRGENMHKSPNWNTEEIMLALELYLSKDLEWLSKMRDDTFEIMTLSYILQNLDFHGEPKPEKFRSVGSVRMKLSNFKAVDERYGKRSLSNIGKLDRSVFDNYFHSFNKLIANCNEIIKEHFVGNYNADVQKYLSAFTVSESADKEKDFEQLSNDVNQILTKYLEICQQSNRTELVYACKNFLSILSSNNYRNDNYIEHGGVNQKRAGSETKIGALVRSEMSEMIKKGILSPYIYNQLKSKNWCRETFHIGYPLIKEINDKESLKAQIRDEKGNIRYWKNIYHFGKYDFVLCKEWYESNRKYFLSWLSSVSTDSSEAASASDFFNILNYIQATDSKEVSILALDIKNRFTEYQKTDELINYLLEKGVLAPYQGSLREFVVEDYDLLFDMLQRPENYNGEF